MNPGASARTVGPGARTTRPLANGGQPGRQSLSRETQSGGHCCVDPRAVRLHGRTIWSGEINTSGRRGSAFAGFRFPPEAITLAVRGYLRFGLSYRDVEELLAERGVEVDHTTLFRWVRRFTPLFTEAARPLRHPPRRSLVC